MKIALFFILIAAARVSIADTLTITHGDRKCVFQISPTEVTIEASELGNTEKDQTALTANEQKELKKYLDDVAVDKTPFDRRKCSTQNIEWKTAKQTKYACLSANQSPLFKLSQWLVNRF